MRHLVLLPAFLACSPGANQLPPESSVVPELVLTLPGYSEGVVIDVSGTTFISVGRNPQDSHAVYQYRAGAPPARWFSLRLPNGHKILPDGTHIVAGEGVVLRLSPDAVLLTTWMRDGEGHTFRRPNDIALDGHRGFYFTDPGGPEAGAKEGKLFFTDSTFRITLAADSLCYPNGLVVRPDGRAVYLDDSCNGRVYRFPIEAPGRLGAPVILATLRDSTNAGLDGMTLDAAGRLYIAHNGLGTVDVLDTAGHLLRRYPAGQALASNVAFSPTEPGALLVTGSPIPKSGPGGLYRLRLGVQGRASTARPKP